MTTYRVTARGFRAAFARKTKKDRKLLEVAALESAQRGVAHAVSLTNSEGLVDLGTYKKSWGVKRRRTPRGRAVDLGNRAPYSPTLEHGRRPGRAGPPLAPLIAWVKRKFGLSGKGDAEKATLHEEAKRIAWLIRRKIQLKGTKPYHIMRRTRRKVMRWWREDYRRRRGR